MQYSDTSGKQGLIQDCEFLTNLGYGTISGDANLLAEFTRLLNIKYAKALAKVQNLTGRSGPEDTNYPDQQFSYFGITSGVNSYQFLTDEDGATITDITGVLLLPSATSTEYAPLDRLSLSDADALLVMSPNASNTGTPTGYIEKSNTIFLDKLPNYTAALGGKLFYRLVPSYFITSDTTKKPGFLDAYHRLLSAGASLDWLLVYKPENGTLITRVEADLQEMATEFAVYVKQRNPTRSVITGATHSSR